MFTDPHHLHQNQNQDPHQGQDQHRSHHQNHQHQNVVGNISTQKKSLDPGGVSLRCHCLHTTRQKKKRHWVFLQSWRPAGQNKHPISKGEVNAKTIIDYLPATR